MNLTNRLSKSRYTKGLRCPLALYLSIHHYELAGELSPATRARMDAGTGIHEIAQGRYPGGVLIDEDYLHTTEAVEHTRRELDAGAETLFEAAFIHDNVKVRVDVLRKLPDGGWELIEIKSTGGYVADKHLADAGVQLHVLFGCGIDVRRVTLLHMNKAYVYPGGGSYDLQELFAPTDITDDAFGYLDSVPAALEWMMEMLAQPEPPVVPTTVSCTKPYECEFHAWCHRDEVEPDVNAPAEYVPSVIRRLNDLRFPLHFVDFETMNPALPIFPGTSPFQVARVQWSIHTLHEDGRLTHQEWLVEDADKNPDAEFMETLLAALPDTGTFVHYSAYERTQLVDIACRNPEWRQPLVDAIPGFYDKLAEKLAEAGQGDPGLHAGTDGSGLLDFDLGARVVREGCLHPVFGPDGKGWTIKSAIKILAQELPPYDGLAVCNGDEAMVQTARMLDSATEPETAAQIRKDLLEYCAQDTMSMVMIYRALRATLAN